MSRAVIYKKTTKTNTLALLAAFVGMLVALVVIGSEPAMAAAVAPAPDGTCTIDPQFNPTPPSPGQGVLSRIVENVKNVLNNLSQSMYNYIVSNGGFRDMVYAMMSLYIAIYGIMFMFAMVQVTLFDFATRMIKFGIVFAVISGGSWSFFNNTVVTFFNDGTDDLIYELTSIAVGGISNQLDLAGGDPPFAIIDNVVHQALSAKMAVTMLSAFFTGPYGLLFGLLILMSLGAFMRALLVAVWVYVMSLVVKTLLFGIAPLFIICLLFNRTRHLFQGWLNQVLNASLQPIFLFAFFAFFAKLIEAALDNILQVPVCWTETMESVRGTPFNMHYWRFMLNNEPYGGQWDWTGADAPGSPTFPIDIMDVLIFLILAELASRFNSVVLMIARDLANSTTNLADMQGALRNFMGGGRGPGKGRKGALPGAAGAAGRDRVAGPAGGARNTGLAGPAGGASYSAEARRDMGLDQYAPGAGSRGTP